MVKKKEQVITLKEESDAIFIDVRTPAEYLSSHIKGSFNIPLDEIHYHINDFKKLNKDVILVSKSDNVYEDNCPILQEYGHQNIKIMKSGVRCWRESKLPVTINKNIWPIERQVRLYAGFLILSGTLLGFLVDQSFYIIPGLVGFGFAYAALSDTCGLGYVLSKLPYNKKQGKYSTSEILNKIKK